MAFQIPSRIRPVWSIETRRRDLRRYSPVDDINLPPASLHLEAEAGGHRRISACHVYGSFENVLSGPRGPCSTLYTPLSSVGDVQI